LYIFTIERKGEVIVVHTARNVPRDLLRRWEEAMRLTGESMEYRALDIAKYIIKHEHDAGRQISNLRLQKLLYFAQAKFLIETGKPCFSDPIMAWEFGPVVTSVYHEYKIFGGLDIFITPACIELDKDTRERIDNLLEFCVKIPTYKLVDITHSQAPWQNARNNITSSEITIDSIKQYFQKK